MVSVPPLRVVVPVPVIRVHVALVRVAVEVGRGCVLRGIRPVDVVIRLGPLLVGLLTLFASVLVRADEFTPVPIDHRGRGFVFVEADGADAGEAIFLGQPLALPHLASELVCTDRTDSGVDDRIGWSVFVAEAADAVGFRR